MGPIDATETLDRVLVVEDHDEDAILIRRALRPLSRLSIHRVLDEAGFREALDHPWDLVLTDYRLPTCDAERVLSLVQEVEEPPRVVVVSGVVGEESAAGIMRSGAADFVSKDNLSRLPSVVEREIGHGHRQRQLTRIQAELGHQTQRMRSLLDSVPDELLAVSTDGTVRTYHHGGSEPGLVVDGTPGTKLADAVRPEAAAQLVKLVKRVGRERGVDTVELSLGDHRSFEVRARFSHEHEVVVAMRDISTRRLLERQVLAAQRLEAVGRLASGVAHDFNNIITVVRSYADLIAHAVDGTNTQVREDVDVIIDASDRASRLTAQLLAFSRKQVQELQTLDVNEAVLGVQKMLRRLIGEDVRIITNLSKFVSTVRVDPAQLDQVVINLAVNAREAMPKGGTLTLGSAEHVDATGQRWVQLLVTDDGEGMDQQTRQHIFEPFFTTKKERGGTGLGLSTVYGIVRQSGGTIELDSEVGVGTTFTISLPAADPDKAVSRPPEPSTATLRGRERIVLAEDDPHLGRATRRLLEKHGYDCRIFSNGRDALEAVVAGDVDLLVTDLVMPEMDGVALSQRARARGAQVPCLFVSGYADEAIAERGLELGPADVFLRKPFSRQELLEKVREAIARGKMSQATLAGQ